MAKGHFDLTQYRRPMSTDLWEGWEKLSFAMRQQKWDGSFQRTFIQNNGRGKKPSLWSIAVEGDRVSTSHWIQDGAVQSTNYAGKAKNVGRSNAITAEQDALAEARRDIRKKWEFEGYDEMWGGQNIDLRNQNTSVQHLLTSLPGSFCLYKPENNFWDQTKLVALSREGKVWYTVKRDGMAKLIVIDYFGNIQIYSRRARPYHKDEGPKEAPDGTLDYGTMIPWGTRFPHLIAAVKALNLPNGTMLAGELIYRPTEDNFPYMQSLTKSLTPQAIEDMNKLGLPFFYWWDMPFYDGVNLLATACVRSRFGQILEATTIAGASKDPETKRLSSYILPVVARTFPSPEEAVAVAKELKIEGWVVVDPEGIYGDKGWNVKGKPDRPSICAKLKPKQEDDFVAHWHPDTSVGTWGTGKHEAGKTVTLPDGQKVVHSGVGSIALYQYNTNGELVFISNCSSGMDYSLQARLTRASFPFVCKVEYNERAYISDGDKTNALRHPVFLEIRTDKEINECINQRL